MAFVLLPVYILKIGYDMLQARFTNTKLKDEEIKRMPMIFQLPHYLFLCFAVPVL